MKLRFLFTTLVAVSLTILSESYASTEFVNRVRTVPKESKESKDKKEEESKASAVKPKPLTPSTASLIVPAVQSKLTSTHRTCSQTEEDCEKLLAQGSLRK